jgi:FkbM family methyltransferase
LVLVLNISAIFTRVGNAHPSVAESTSLNQVSGGDVSRLESSFAVEAYAQEGEDLILSDHLPSAPGFYIDVGAHHPYRFSNTRLLYKKGWRGINIDPDPSAISLFNVFRPEDRNILAAIGTTEGEENLLIFDEAALNTLNDSRARELEETTRYRVVSVQKVSVLPLTKIVPPHFSADNFCLLNIDVEGRELDVLRSNDWSVFQPQLVVCEIHSEIDELDKNEVHQFLTNLGYRLVGKTNRNGIYKLFGRPHA